MRIKTPRSGTTRRRFTLFTNNSSSSSGGGSGAGSVDSTVTTAREQQLGAMLPRNLSIRGDARRVVYPARRSISPYEHAFGVLGLMQEVP